MRFSMAFLGVFVAVFAASVAGNPEANWESAWISEQLTKPHAPIGLSASGDVAYQHTSRFLAPTGRQVLFDYSATRKHSVAILDDAPLPAGTSVACSADAVVLTIPMDDPTTSARAFVDSLGIRVGGYLHGNASYGCYEETVKSAAPFYREIEAISIDDSHMGAPVVVTVSTFDVPPQDLFTDLSIDLKELPVSTADWAQFFSSPALRTLRDELVRSDEASAASTYDVLASDHESTHAHGDILASPEHTAAVDAAEARLFLDHPEVFTLPTTATDLSRLRATPSSADLDIASELAGTRVTHVRRSPDSPGFPSALGAPKVGAVYLSSEDSTMFTPGDTLTVVIDEASGFPSSSAVVKLRIFTDDESWAKTEKTFVGAVTAPLDVGVAVTLTNSFVRSTKMYADVCFYSSSVPESKGGLSCSGAVMVKPVCSLDDMQCKDSANKIFFVDTNQPFTLVTPGPGTIADPASSLSTSVLFHGATGYANATFRLMRYRMLSISDEVVSVVKGQDLSPGHQSSVTFSPDAGVAGSIYPYYIQVQFSCGLIFCKKWKSPYFTVPRDYLAQWNYDPQSRRAVKRFPLSSFDCQDYLAKHCSNPSDYEKQANCGRCRVTNFRSYLGCDNCFVFGRAALGGVRVRPLAAGEDRFLVTVAGGATARVQIDGDFSVQIDQSYRLPPISVTVAGISFRAAGISFNIKLSIDTVLGMDLTASVNGEVSAYTEIRLPAFATVIKYGKSSGSFAKPTLVAEGGASASMAGTATATAVINPSLVVGLSAILDASIDLPLYLRAVAEGSTHGLPPSSTHSSVPVKFGHCNNNHRIEVTGTAGARPFTAHAATKVFRRWLPASWDWTLWGGNSIDAIHGCAFPIPANVDQSTILRISFSAEWTWQIPRSFSSVTDKAVFMRLLTADLAKASNSRKPRFHAVFVNSYSSENPLAVADAEADAAVAERAGAILKSVDLGSQVGGRIFQSIASAAAAAASAADASATPESNGRQTVVVEVRVLEDDPDHPIEGRRSAKAVTDALLSALSTPSVAAPGSFLAYSVCAPSARCGTCVNAGCAYCPTNGRCEAAKSGSSCSSKFIVTPSKCPNNSEDEAVEAGVEPVEAETEAEVVTEVETEVEVEAEVETDAEADAEAEVEVIPSPVPVEAAAEAVAETEAEAEVEAEVEADAEVTTQVETEVAVEEAETETESTVPEAEAEAEVETEVEAEVEADGSAPSKSTISSSSAAAAGAAPGPTHAGLVVAGCALALIGLLFASFTLLRRARARKAAAAAAAGSTTVAGKVAKRRPLATGEPEPAEGGHPIDVSSVTPYAAI